MKCPYCGSLSIKVTNSRPTRNNTQIWRRRKCWKCKEVFTTYERIDLDYLKVAKKDGRVTRYSRAKLYSGVYHASLHSKKGADRGDMGYLSEQLTNEVEKELIGFKKNRVTTEDIRNVVLSVLKKREPAIFLSFLAYFKGPVNYSALKKTVREHIT